MRFWLTLAAICAVYFIGLGRIPLVGPDEPRYAQVAREMYLRGDLITPALGGHTWFEKPALLYWSMISAYRIFGVSEFAARFGSALAGLFVALMIFWLVRRVARAGGERLDGVGELSGFIFATSLGAIVFSHGASFDMLLTATVTLALSAFFIADLETERRPFYLACFYVALGLGLLAKGLVGIALPLGVVIVYSSVRGQLLDTARRSGWWWGAPLTLATAALWYGPVIARHGWLFVDEFFLQHHFARYLSNKYHHPQPFYFYLPVMALLALPWTPVLIAALVSLRRANRGEVNVVHRVKLFALFWLVVPVAFFSFSGSKLPGYVLPALPGAAILVGLHLTETLRRALDQRWIAVVLGVLFVALGIGGAVYALREAQTSVWCAGSVAVVLVSVGSRLLLKRRLRSADVWLTGGAVLASVLLISLCAAESVALRHSTRDLLRRADALGFGKAPILNLHTVERTAEFYGSGRVVYDERGEPRKLEGTFQVADIVAAHGGPVLVFVPLEHAHQLTEEARLHAEKIGDNGQVALFAVDAK